MATTTLDPGWRVQLAVHRAVRRDLRRLSSALEGRGTPQAAILAYWAVTRGQLHEHHVLEDEVVWPLMRQRLGAPVEALLDRNAQEHQDMAAAMEEFGAVVASMTTDTAPARAALGRLHEVVEKHLAHEEADVLPLIPDAFTLEDIAFFTAEAAKTNPPSVFLPWLLDDAPETDVAFFTGPMPPPVENELRSTWTPQWRAKVDALRLPSTIPNQR